MFAQGITIFNFILIVTKISIALNISYSQCCWIIFSPLCSRFPIKLPHTLTKYLPIVNKLHANRSSFGALIVPSVGTYIPDARSHLFTVAAHLVCGGNIPSATRPQTGGLFANMGFSVGTHTAHARIYYVPTSRRSRIAGLRRQGEKIVNTIQLHYLMDIIGLCGLYVHSIVSWGAYIVTLLFVEHIF